MKPTNNNGEIFPCNNCGNHAQPTPQPSNRKKVILKEYYNNESYYLNLTDEQIALLSWMVDNIVDAGYEVIDTIEFEAIH